MPVLYQFRHSPAELCLFVSFWIAPRMGIFEALGCNFCEVVINFRDVGEAA
jgi:hypothetical protein